MLAQIYLDEGDECIEHSMHKNHQVFFSEIEETLVSLKKNRERDYLQCVPIFPPSPMSSNQ